MKTKKRLYASFGVATLLAAPSVFAAFSYDGTIQFTGGGGGNANGGGVFNVTTTASGGTTPLGNFGTFCIEHDEFISVPSDQYAYKMNTGAVAGGNGGATTIDLNTGLTMDNVSIGTAYLYSQYRAGAIGTTDAQKNNLQMAIWYLENELDYLVAGSADGSAYYTLAKNNAGTAVLDDIQVFADSGGAYGVIALNVFQDNNHNGIYDTGDDIKQDQLGIVPEPSTVIAAALLLLPFGASTIRILRKNRVA